MNNISELILSERLKCLSCTTRREILQLTKENCMTVRDIAKVLNMAQNTIKRHVKILSDCELLSISKYGNNRIYSTNIENLHDTVNALNGKIN